MSGKIVEVSARGALIVVVSTVAVPALIVVVWMSGKLVEIIIGRNLVIQL